MSMNLLASSLFVPVKNLLERNRKDKSMKVSTLTTRSHFVARLPEGKVPLIPAWQTERTLQSDLIFVTDIKEQTHTKENLRVAFFNPKTRTNEAIYLKNDFNLIVVTKKKDKALIEKEYEAAILQNLPQQLGHSFDVGSDPEIFIEDNKGAIVPAFEFLPAKKAPVVVATGGETIYWDGFQAEFTTKPYNCLAYQVDSVHFAMKKLLQLAKAHCNTARLSSRTLVDIPSEARQGAKEEHVAFGCMPSFNVYGLKGPSIPGRECEFRSAGGHIHFGCGKKSPDSIDKIVRALDAILGVACVSLFEKYDSPKRRMMYGMAGEYRTPPHGLEYRVLSNAWMFHPLMMNLVFDLSRKVFIFGEKGLLKHWKATEKETIECIQNCDAKSARAILKRNVAIFKQLLKAAYYQLSDAQITALYDVFINGADSVIADMNDISTNWQLENGHYQTHSEGKSKAVKHAIEAITEGKKIA